MGNGVSGDQGNLPAHGKRDVREGVGARRHDWSELARTRELVTSPPILTSYTNTDATFSNVQSIKFHSKQFCTCFMVAVLIHNSAL